MASEDVIELGSSDDEAEAEPPPKRRKPALNAMVHFPSKRPGVAIKPNRTVSPSLEKVIAGGAITITNLKTGKVSSQVNKAKVNGKPLRKQTMKTPMRVVYKPIQGALAINPMSLKNQQQNIRTPGPKLNLPPGITVKRAASETVRFSTIPIVRKSQNIRKRPPQRVVTVELDDEVTPPTTVAGPQWYLRPEEQTEQPEKKEEESKDKQDNVEKTENSIEAENNKEPDKSTYIEITIEDSPIKPVKSKRTHEVGSELAITIEDSPVKTTTEKPDVSSSDSENVSTSAPQSKKKLNYPKGEDEVNAMQTETIIEIDFDKPINIAENTDEVMDETITPDEVKTKETEVIRQSQQQALIPKDVKAEEKFNDRTQESDSEFHPVYQRFIDLCFQLENSDDMKKIVEKKIKTYYRQCPKEYVESEEFIDMVSSKIFAMKAGPDKMYLYIKDIVDELNLQRKSAKAEVVLNKESKEKGNNTYFCDDNAEYDSKRRRQIRKLEKTIKKLHRAVQKLEEQEVEFEDEEDSVYLLTERYKERLIRVHAKFCQLTNTKMPSEPRIQIEARPGRSSGPAKRLEKWVNRKVPIGKPLPFPDFHDVLRCVREANDEDRLGWNEADIMEEARDLFTRCGRKLQRRRQENEWRIAVSRISHDVSTLDPAEESDVLRKRLEENKNMAAIKETELLNKYADKQNQLKLVAEEIGDKEAEESPVESEDDDDDSNSLEDKQKRKDRLKRLLHEKTRKKSAEMDGISINEQNTCKEEAGVKSSEEKEVGEVNKISEEKINKDKEENIKETMDESLSTEAITDTTTAAASAAPNSPTDDKRLDECDMKTYDVDSDIDELHLLQKLYSENEINSSAESDSDTPIAISDTLDSDSEPENNKKQYNDDIISIENSSYSESEITKDEYAKDSNSSKDKSVEGMLLDNVEIELSSVSRSKAFDYDENILLASSDEEMDNNHRNSDTIKHTATISNDDSTSNNDEVTLNKDEDTNNANKIAVEKVITVNEHEENVTEPMITNDSLGNVVVNDVCGADEGNSHNLKLGESVSGKGDSQTEDALEIAANMDRDVVMTNDNETPKEDGVVEENSNIIDEVTCAKDVNTHNINNEKDENNSENNSNHEKNIAENSEMVPEKFDIISEKQAQVDTLQDADESSTNSVKIVNNSDETEITANESKEIKENVLDNSNK